MKSKILIAVLVILSVAMYTLAVINFTQWNALHGIEDVIIAVTGMIAAFVIFRQQLDHKLNELTATALADILKALEKGVRATLTVKDGKATVQVNDEEDDDKPDESEQASLTDEEKRIKRMDEEYDELSGRLDRLTAFLASDKFQTLPENSRTLLTKQHQAMTDYEAALKQRIQIDCANTGK